MHLLLIAVVIGLVLSGSVARRHRPMENPDLFEGDILGVKSIQERNAVVYESEKWTNGIIPYIINDDIGDQVNDVVTAIEHISGKTCIQFVPRTDEEDYLDITYGDGWSGCSSHWGRTGGRQELILGDGCYALGTIVHELMHAIGFEHEHNRSDRDDYVTIFWDNIDEMYQTFFMKLSPRENRLLTDFDYESIMMYGSKAFANDDSLDSMVAKDGTELKEVADKAGLSELDVKKVNTLYECESS